MKEVKLKKSPVMFYKDTHTYMLGDRQLQGITGMIGRRLFPDKYKAVPEKVLNNAAERGHRIHEECEAWDMCDIIPTSIEGNNYMKLVSTHQLKHEDSEYLVSDNEYFASCIDKVYRVDENSFILGDIKTTYTLDEEYLRWQLSIYAYLFEKQNPKAKVEKLVGIWLKDDNAKIVDIQRIDGEIVKQLLDAEIDGLPFTFSEPNTMPERYRQIEGKIEYIVKMEKFWAAEKKRLVDGIRKEMVLGGAYKWEGDKVKITRNKESIRKEFDKEAFKKDYPELFEKYIKEVQVSGSLTIKCIKE